MRISLEGSFHHMEGAKDDSRSHLSSLSSPVESVRVGVPTMGIPTTCMGADTGTDMGTEVGTDMGSEEATPMGSEAGTGKGIDVGAMGSGTWPWKG